MKDVMLQLVDVPMVRMFVLAGIIFLLVAVLGKIEGKIEPGRIGRIGAALLGTLLIVIGLIMQYGERPDMYANLPPNLIATFPQNVVAATPASAAPAIPVMPIKVVSGAWGRNCNAQSGNATALLAKTCDGHSSCDFLIDMATLADPAPNCSKDFAAEWKCGDGNAIYSAALSTLSGKNDRLRLNCSGQ